MEKELKAGIARSQRSDNAEINQTHSKALLSFTSCRKLKRKKKIAGDTISCERKREQEELLTDR